MMLARSGIVARLIYPLRSSVAGSIILFVLAEGLVRLVGGTLMLMSPTMGRPLAWIVGLIVFVFMAVLLVQYSSVVFVASAMGEARVRVVDVSDLLPFSTPVTGRLIFLVMLLAVIGPLFWLYSPAFVWLLSALLALFLLPAVLAILALDRSLPAALNPRNLVAFIAPLGPRYLLMPLLWAAVLAAVFGLWQSSLSWLPRSLISGYLYFLCVHLLGRIVYWNRDRIGLIATSAPEHARRQEQRDLDERHANMLEHAYQKSKSSVDDALRLIEQYLAANDDTLEARSWIFDRLSDWSDKATAVWFANDLVARQIRRGLADDAMRTTAWCLTHNPAFRPQGADATFELANLAFRNGRNAVGTAMLSDLAERFPDSPHALPAMLLCAQVALEKTNQRPLARRLISQLESDAKHREDPRVAALRELAGAD